MKIKPNLNATGIHDRSTFYSSNIIKVNARYLFTLIGFGLGSLISLVILIFEDNNVDIDVFSYHSDFYHLAIPFLIGITGTFIGFFHGKKQDKKRLRFKNFSRANRH